MIILLQPPAGRDSQFCAHRVNKCRQLVETHTPMKSTVGTDDRMERRETERGRQKKNVLGGSGLKGGALGTRTRF